MADLDDFFAKKDRKKSKTSTKKFTTTATAEELAKKVDETVVKKPEPIKKPIEGATAEEADVVQEVKEDEWEDFKEEEQRDYTGLKIGQLQITDDSDISEGGADGDGEDDENRERKSGPWKKVAEGSSSSAPAKEPVVAPPPDKGNVPKLYISPAMRNQQATLKPINLRKGALPDLANEELFPTLGSVRPEDLKKKKNEPAFEEVKHGSRFQRASDLPTNAPVIIGNRYNSLADS